MIDMCKFGKQLDKMEPLDIATALVGCYTLNAVEARYASDDVNGLRQMAFDVITDTWDTFPHEDVDFLVCVVMAA